MTGGAGLLADEACNPPHKPCFFFLKAGCFIGSHSMLQSTGHVILRTLTEKFYFQSFASVNTPEIWSLLEKEFNVSVSLTTDTENC